jgi:hypothetical protein
MHADGQYFDVKMRQAIRNRTINTVRSHLRYELLRNWKEVEKWLLDYARDANKHTPVASAITTKEVNARRRLPSMTLTKY